MFDLTGKTALVTGATGGIGGQIAKDLAANGAEVIITGRNEAALNELAKALGAKAKTIACDLSKQSEVETLIAKAEEKAGKVDILINNAGLTKDTLMMRMKPEDWDEVLNVNLKAAFILSKDAIRGMIKRRFGRIISISSIVGVMGNAGQANYAASKAGLIAMSKSLALEVASRGITVNCIAPGFIATKMTDTIPEAARDALIAKIPAVRLGMPSDIAAAALFLSSDEASYITGQTLHVNGGMAMI
jgi:3-oxoacyl-[acyl-carrier protein] reductase